MWQITKRFLIGLVIGTLLVAILGNGQRLPTETVLLFYLWSLGSVFSFKHHISIILKMLNPGLKLSLISFLTFSNGFMGSFPILLYVTYCLLFGWVHGIVLMAAETFRAIM